MDSVLGLKIAEVGIANRSAFPNELETLEVCVVQWRVWGIKIARCGVPYNIILSLDRSLCDA